MNSQYLPLIALPPAKTDLLSSRQDRVSRFTIPRSEYKDLFRYHYVRWISFLVQNLAQYQSWVTEQKL